MKTREGKIIAVSFVGILGNLALVALKAVIGIIAGAASLISDAINNLTDALSSLLTIIGTKLSNKRPNKKHPFGYGRIEYLTSTIIGALILFAGGSAIYESITSLVKGETPTYDNAALIIISSAILVKVALGLFFRNRGKKLESEPLKDSGMDALLDSLLSLGTLVAALISRFGNVHLEGYFGIAIGLFIIKSGVGVLVKSMSSILGERMDDDAARALKAELCAHPSVIGAYDLIVHDYGPNQRIGSVHVEVEEELTAKEIQVLEREIGAYCYEKHGIIMTVGVYAHNTKDGLGKTVLEEVRSLIEDHPEIIQTHGLFADEENKTISFDLVIAYSCKEPLALIQEIKGKVEELHPGYLVIINLDNDFSA